MDQEFTKDILLVVAGAIATLVVSCFLFWMKGKRDREKISRDNLDRLDELCGGQQAMVTGYYSFCGVQLLTEEEKQLLPPTRPNQEDKIDFMIRIVEVHHPRYLGRVNAIHDAQRAYTKTLSEFTERRNAERRRGIAAIHGNSGQFWKTDLNQAKDAVLELCEQLRNAIRDDRPK